MLRMLTQAMVTTTMVQSENKSNSVNSQNPAGPLIELCEANGTTAKTIHHLATRTTVWAAKICGRGTWGFGTVEVHHWITRSSNTCTAVHILTQVMFHMLERQAWINQHQNVCSDAHLDPKHECDLTLRSWQERQLHSWHGFPTTELWGFLVTMLIW